MSGYDFHPQARLDLDEIWEFIRAECRCRSMEGVDGKSAAAVIAGPN